MEDELCVAWSASGIVGLGRKIFPVCKGESGYREVDELICYESDYSTTHRVVHLASGRKAVLCACYDMFGVQEVGRANGLQANGLKRIQANGHQFRRDGNLSRENWAPATSSRKSATAA